MSKLVTIVLTEDLMLRKAASHV